MSNRRSCSFKGKLEVFERKSQLINHQVKRWYGCKSGVQPIVMIKIARIQPKVDCLYGEEEAKTG